MLKMSVIILIGILVVSGDEDIKSIETISEIEDKSNLENSRIVIIKIKPDLPVPIRRIEINDNAEPETADDQELIYVNLKTDITQDFNPKNDPPESSTDINVNTRRFLTDNDSETAEITSEVQVESTTSDPESSTIDVAEKTAENNPTEISPTQEVPKTDVIIITPVNKSNDLNLNAESKTITEKDADIDSDTFLISDRSNTDGSEAPTRRNYHYNSSVLNNDETTKETVKLQSSEHKVEISRQDSEVIEEDFETVEPVPSENTRRRFNNDLNDYPEVMIIDDDRIKSTKSTKIAHDVLLDTRARSGMPQDDFNVPGHTYYYSEPYYNYQHYNDKDKTMYNQFHNSKTVTGYQYQNVPIADHQTYTNKHATYYKSQNTLLAVDQPGDIDIVGGYQRHDILTTAGYKPYNTRTRPPVDYQPNPPYHYIRPNFGSQPQFISQPYNTIPITVYQPYSKNHVTEYPSHNIKQFVGFQQKSIPIHNNYLPQYDNTKSFTVYKPKTKPISGNQPFINKHAFYCYQPHGINPIVGNRPQIVPTPNHQLYNNKSALHYKRFEEKLVNEYPYHHNINLNVEYQSPNIDRYQPYVTKHIIDVQPDDTTAIRGKLPKNYNVNTNIYQPSNKPIAIYKPHNSRPDYQQFNLNPSKPFVVNQQYISKSNFNNRRNDIPLAGHHNQDTSHLSPIHQRNQQNFHPVYGNRQHYIPQNLQPQESHITNSGITINPIHMGNLGMAKKGCQNQRCNPISNLKNIGSTIVNTVHPNYANRNGYRPRIYSGIDLNANIGYYRTTDPYSRNVRVTNRMNPNQYSGHLINVRSVDSNRTSETNYNSSEDEVYYDDYGSKNNYPHFTRHNDEGSIIYHYEPSNNYPYVSQSSDSNTYESQDASYNFDESRELISVETLGLYKNENGDANISSFETRRLTNNPMEPTGSNISPNDSRGPITETRDSNNKPLKPKGSDNGPIHARGSIPYERQGFNNSPDEYRGTNINIYESKVSSNNPYDSRGPSPYEDKGTNINPYEPIFSNINPNDPRGTSLYEPLDEPQGFNTNPLEHRGYNNSPRGSYNNAFEPKGLFINPNELRGLLYNPYEPQIGLLSDHHMPPLAMLKRFNIGG